MRRYPILACLLVALLTNASAQAAVCVYEQADTSSVVPGGNTWIERITSTGAETVSSMQVHFSGVTSNMAYVGIYGDNLGAPGTLLASSAETAISNGWNTINFTGSIGLSDATVYWVAIASDNPSVFHSSTFNALADVVMTGAYGALVSDPVITGTGTTDSFAIRLGNCSGATPTPTDTPGIVPTTTASPTSTCTVSATATPTGTLTGTLTGTPTGTPTGTLTGTLTGTPTGTLTGTLTGTPTGTLTGTLTGTPAGTPSGTPTASATSSSSPSATMSPSPTPTHTSTTTPTHTPSSTGTGTATPTSTASATSTPSATATSSATFTVTPSVTGTSTASPTFTASPVFTPIVFPTPIDCELDVQALGLSRLAPSSPKEAAPVPPDLAAVAPQPVRSGDPLCLVFNQDLGSYSLVLHALDGHLVARRDGSGSRACLTAPAPGVYVIYVEGRSHLGEAFQRQAKLAVVGR